LYGLFAAASQFSAALPRDDGWLNVVVSAAKVARVNNLKEWQGLHSLEAFRSKPRNTQNLEWIHCIYLALDHVQQQWEANRDDSGDSHTWDFKTVEAIDSLLQVLAFADALPDKPPLTVLRTVLQALSSSHTSSAAFVVLYLTRQWFLDLDLQQMILESAVWPHVARIALEYSLLFSGWRYMEMVEKVAHAPEWKPCLYPELYTWIAVFDTVTQYIDLEEWSTPHRFVTVSAFSISSTMLTHLWMHRKTLGLLSKVYPVSKDLPLSLATSGFLISTTTLTHL
jgi:hypothetical protein